MSELFNENEIASLSPRGAWMQEHQLNVYFDEELGLPWVAWHKQTKAQGATKDIALFALASKLKIRFYQ
tara:strand:- start:267 stop:473 length:207 start_codon:yes stop_codon:yes gene_type:complete